MSSCQDKPTLLPEALWKALMNLPALRYMKAPVFKESDLYKEYPTGNEWGTFAYVHEENTFFIYHPRGRYARRWRPISADGVSSFFEIDKEFLKEGDILVWDNSKQKFVVKSGNVWNKLIGNLKDTFSQVTKFLNQVEDIPTDESDSGVYFVHKDNNDVEFRALYIVLGKKAVKIFNSSDWFTKTEVTQKIDDTNEHIDSEIKRLEENMVNLGIRKTYPTYEAMQADVSNPMGDDGMPIKNGELVMVVNTNDSSKDGVYRYKIVNNVKSWEYAGGVGIVSEINEKTDKGGYAGTTEDLNLATKVAQESLLQLSNNQYLFAFVTANGRVVLACTKDGKILMPKGVPDEVAISLASKIGLSDILQELRESEYPVSGEAITKVITTLETIYPYVVLDAEGKMIEWTDKSAKKYFPKQQLIDVIDSDQVDYAIMYASNQMPFFIKNGKVYANMPVLTQAVKDIEDLKSGASYNRLVVNHGDSLTAGAGGGGTTYSTVLQSLLGNKYTVLNRGVGGENVPTIASRQGGVPAVITEAFVLPADTSKIEISSYSNIRLKNLLNNADVRWLRQGGSAYINPVYVCGIECTLSITQTSSTSTDAVWLLNRNVVATEETSISANTPIYTIDAKNYRNPYIANIWIGQNGGFTGNDQLVDYYKRMIEFAGTTNYLTIGLHSGNATSRKDLEETMEKEFGLRFLNWRRYISSLQAFQDANIVPTQADIDAMAVGSLPPSFWSSTTDSVHLNAAAYTLLGKAVYNRHLALGSI